MVKVGIIGASGYAGAELIRILLHHPGVEVRAIISRTHTGEPLANLYPHLRGWTNLTFAPEAALGDVDLVLTAVPHGVTAQMAPELLSQGKKVIDLGADYRFRDPADYKTWYGLESVDPQGCRQAIYGLPELYRPQIPQTCLVANPGCYPTSVILALAPFLRANLVELGSLIIDSASGTSGAGRGLKEEFHFSELSGDYRAYGVGGSHRHTGEMEQEVSALAGEKVQISFTPHLLPTPRGILSTIHFKASEKPSRQILEEAYADEPFVRVLPEGSLPRTKAVVGSNVCEIAMVWDPRTQVVTLLSALDNLIKGAAGQAVQNLNLLYGMEETTGLLFPGIYP